MHEYSFVRIAIGRRREGAVLQQDYREVIVQRAAEGWRFVQAIPFETHAEPCLDLVFSRKVNQ